MSNQSKHPAPPPSAQERPRLPNWIDAYYEWVETLGGPLNNGTDDDAKNTFYAGWSSANYHAAAPSVAPASGQYAKVKVEIYWDYGDRQILPHLKPPPTQSPPPPRRNPGGVGL